MTELRAFPPQIYALPDFTAVQVPAQVAGPPVVPGSIGPFRFQFPRPEFVQGIMIIPRGNVLGIVPEMAKLSIAISDSKQRQIFTDGRGQTIGNTIPFDLAGLSASGQGLRYFALQRPVSVADAWQITVFNRHTAILYVMSVNLLLRRDYR